MVFAYLLYNQLQLPTVIVFIVCFYFYITVFIFSKIPFNKLTSFIRIAVCKMHMIISGSHIKLHITAGMKFVYTFFRCSKFPGQSFTCGDIQNIFSQIDFFTFVMTIPVIVIFSITVFSSSSIREITVCFHFLFFIFRRFLILFQIYFGSICIVCKIL